MITIAVILLISAFTLSFVQHERYRISNPVANSKQWHFWKGCMQLCFFGLVAVVSWRIALVGIVLYWILHDIFVNLLALNQPVFYVGYTGAIDKFFRRFGNPALAMVAAKLVALVVAVLVAVLF